MTEKMCYVRRDRCGCVTAILAHEGLRKREVMRVINEWMRPSTEAIELVEIEAGKKMLARCGHPR